MTRIWEKRTWPGKCSSRANGGMEKGKETGFNNPPEPVPGVTTRLSIRIVLTLSSNLHQLQYIQTWCKLMPPIYCICTKCCLICTKKKLFTDACYSY